MNVQTIKKDNQKQQNIYAAKTGILVDIQNIGKNKKLLAVRESKLIQEISPGVWLQKEAIIFPDGNFSNKYDVCWDPNAPGIAPVISSSPSPYYLYDQVRKNPSTIATINGAFFFLTDVADAIPKDLPYNFCIRENKIFGLPASDEPAAFIQKGKLNAQELKAMGVMMIGKKRIFWYGAKSKSRKKNTDDAILYNSKCSEITKVRDPKTNLQIGILDNEHIKTPNSSDMVDIVVGMDRRGRLLVTQVNDGGNTHFYSGLFILQMKKKLMQVNVGASVVPLTVDILDLRTVDSAITIGKRINDRYFWKPERKDRRDARSLLAKDSHGYIHFIVFDGSKYIPGFNGVSAKDIAKFFSPEKFIWAYFLDGGGSSRIVVRKNKQLQFLANEFAFTKLDDGTLWWNWQKGRKLASSIALTTVGN